MRFERIIRLKNGRECLLRSASGADAQEVYDLFILTHSQTDFLASYGDKPSFDVEFERKFLTTMENDERGLFLCAVVDGRIVGTATVTACGSSEKSRHRAEFGISIDEAYWGMGIGRAMLTSCIESAKEAGYVQLELEVVGENSKAVSLYESAGFREYGRNPRGLRSRVSGWQEEILMYLPLSE